MLPWAALLFGLGASLAANVAAADPTVVGRLGAAWPPVGLLLSYELLMQQHFGAARVRTVRPVSCNPSMKGTEPWPTRHDDAVPVHQVFQLRSDGPSATGPSGHVGWVSEPPHPSIDARLRRPACDHPHEALGPPDADGHGDVRPCSIYRTTWPGS